MADSRRPRVCWIGYEDHGEVWAAVYVDGRLLRHDHDGWWVADIYGRRLDVTADDLALVAVVGCPVGPVWPEQALLEEAAV